MLETKDFELIVNLINKNELDEETEILLEKLNLIIEANKIKEESESKMIEIQDSLRKIYDKQHK